MICMCEQCDSAFCALQLTALIKPVDVFYYIAVLLCAKYDINGSRLNYSTISSKKFKYINMYITCKDKA